MSTNYSELIFLSIDTIISLRLNEVSFDKTEICEIVSLDKNDKRKYLVSNGSLKYEAYSDDENRSYLNNQKVYVRITNGDYSLRKAITGSYATDETNENLYVNPFNHLVTSSTLPLPSSIWAKVNDEEYDDWDDVPSDSTKPNSVEFLTNFNYKNTQNFDYIGLDFSFNTNIVGYLGSYALRISLWNDDIELTNKDDNTLILSSKNLYGNPYNLNSSLSFLHLFPWPTRKKDDKIEPIPITEITKVKLLLILDNNFLKQQGEINVNTDTWIELKKADLKFGYDIKNITKDELLLILEEGQSLKYTTGLTAAARNLYLDWKHFDTFNNPYIFNINQLPNIFEEYAVYWLHYVDGLGENVDLPDEYAWNWETISFIEDLETDLGLTKLINLTTQFRTDLYKVVIKYTTNKFTEEQKNNITIFNNLKSEYKLLLLDLKNPNLTEEDKINKKSRLEEIQKSKELVNSYYTYTESTGLVFDNTDVAADPGASNSSEDSLRIKLDEDDTGVYNIYGLDGRMMDSFYRSPHNIHFEFLDETPLDRIVSINWEFPSENTMIKDVANINKLQATFNIDTMYKPGAMNNRIWCTVTLVTGEIRRGSLTLLFGEAAAAGSNYAFNIDFKGHRTCLYATGEDDSVEIQAVFTKQNGEVMTVPTITWSWMNDYDSPITLSSSTGEKITLTYNNSEVPEENYSILQAKINDYAIDNGLTTNLTAYLPIPIAKLGYNYISGATRVVYDSNGNTATYSRNPYELYNLTNKIENTSWDIISNSTNDTFLLKTLSIRDKNGNIIGEEKTLLPLSYIPQEPPMTCVYCILNENIVWSLPILIIQNRWEYDLLNEWNGKLNINDEQGYILAPLLGAGKKEDNEFTGVMMGDLKLASGSVTNTGLYGFKEGSRRFSFNDKGEAYIGTGDYYIDFDGENLTIKAKNFDLNANNGALVISNEEGIKLGNKISINPDGTAKIGNWQIIENAINSTVYNSDGKECTVSLVNTSSYYHNGGTSGRASDVFVIYDASNTSNPYPFSLWKDGTLNCTKANITGTITATSGSVGGWKIEGGRIYNTNPTTGYTFSLWNPAIAGGTIISCNNGSDYPFYVNRNGFLKATNAEITGTITAKSGSIGKWQINSNSLSNEQTDFGVLLACPTSYGGPGSAGKHDVFVIHDKKNSSYPFVVTSDGGLKATKATITGTITATGGSFGVWVIGKSSYGGEDAMIADDGYNYTAISPKGVYYVNKDGGGDMFRSWGQILVSASDKKLKNSIEYIVSNNNLEAFFNSLKPCTYYYKNGYALGDTSKLHIGFIAQDIQESVNNFDIQKFSGLSEKFREDYFGLNYQEFIALNTWQIQKLKTRVTELENEIKEIKQRYEI